MVAFDPNKWYQSQVVSSNLPSYCWGHCWEFQQQTLWLSSWDQSGSTLLLIGIAFGAGATLDPNKNHQNKGPGELPFLAERQEVPCISLEFHLSRVWSSGSGKCLWLMHFSPSKTSSKAYMCNIKWIDDDQCCATSCTASNEIDWRSR